MTELFGSPDDTVIRPRRSSPQLFGNPGDTLISHPKTGDGADQGTTLLGVTGSITRGLAPIATGAALGAAAGAPFAGVGAIPGAAAGAGAVALTELATSVYDKLASQFGWPKVATPQEMTDRVLDHLGVKRPGTTVERMTEAAAGGAAGAYGPARAAEEFASKATGPVVKAVAQRLAQSPVAQTVSGVTSATAAQTVAEAGGGPLTQSAASLAGALIPAAAGAVGRVALPADSRQIAVEARQAGYVLPPAAVSEKPGVVSSGLAAVSGKVKTHQSASAKNQEITNQLSAQSLGLPRDTPLSKTVFEQVRKEAGKAYRAVGQAVPLISADVTYQQEIAGLAEINPILQQYFPNQLATPKQIAKLMNDLQQREFSPEAGLELVKRLRFNANAHFQARKNPDRIALAMAERRAADSIDDLMDRQITASGQPDVIREYRQARQQIARSYDLEAATNPATGDVNARRIANLDRSGRRRLAGELRTIANTANAFPKAMQSPATFGQDEPWSALDFFGAVTTGLVDPRAAAAILARPVVRSGILTEPYQNWMTSGGPRLHAQMPGITPLPLLLQPGATAVVPPGDISGSVDSAYSVIAGQLQR